MSSATSPKSVTSPFPNPPSLSRTTSHEICQTESLPLSSASSVGSTSESELNPHSSRPSSRRSRMDRPRMADRQRSSSIIIPKGRDTVQREKPNYPPDDARAMSPRRNSEDIERLELGVRKSLQDQARTLQSSLAALAERIDEVRQDHDKLESENRFLQDYIGGLTRTMSKENLGRSSSIRTGETISIFSMALTHVAAQVLVHHHHHRHHYHHHHSSFPHY